MNPYVTGSVIKELREKNQLTQAQLAEKIGVSDDVKKLIPEVRAIRSEMNVCPSSKEGVCVPDILREIIESQVYKKDYEDITMGLLFVPENYENVIESLKRIVDSEMWE